MSFSGSVNVLDPPGAVDKGLVKNQFLIPTGGDITRIDDLLAMTGTPWTPGEITSLARALVAFNSQTKPITLADLASVIVSDATAPFIRASEIGLTGDGVTDDSFPLQQAMDSRATTGGGVYFLRTATPGASFYFAHSVRVPSNTTLLWASPILLAKEATFYVSGRFQPANSQVFRLASDVVMGANILPIDTSPNGGGPVSGLLGVGNQILLFGRRDGCSTATRVQELRITAVSNSPPQVEVHQGLNFDCPAIWPTGAYQANYGLPDRTQIIKLLSASTSADLLAGDNLVLLNSGQNFLVPGDMVLVKDDTTVAQASGVSGGDTAPCNEELALVVPSMAGDPILSLRLDRRVTRNFFASRFLRLIKIDPATSVTISGARFLSAEAPDLSPAPLVHWSEQTYAHGCIFDGCVVPNADIYGKRGNAFRAYRCLDPVYANCSSLRAKFFDNGEGNGIVFDRSTGGKVTGGLHDAMRHGTQVVGGNSHTFHDVTLTNPRHSPVDCHGTLEVDCHWYNCTLIAGTQYEQSEGRAPIAIAFGNPTFLAGPIACGFHGGSITGFKHDGTGGLEAVINLFQGSRDCLIETLCTDIGMLFEFKDLPGLGNIISSGHRIKVQVNGCENTRLVDIQSRANGSANDTLIDIRIEVYGRNLNGCFYVVNATELEICGCDIDETTFNPSASYFVEAAGCTNLRVSDNRVANGSRFVRMNGCLGYRVVGNRSTDQSNSTMFSDAGGNTGIWLDNREVGFLGFYEPDATSSLMVDGRLPGHYDLPDDSVLVLLPVQPKGTGQFYSFSGVSFFARFFYDTVTSFIDLDAVSTSNVDGAIVPLTGTTGIDGRITISVVNATNAIHIENRTGGIIRICGRVD